LKLELNKLSPEGEHELLYLYSSLVFSFDFCFSFDCVKDYKQKKLKQDREASSTSQNKKKFVSILFLFY